jgi:DNA-binding transcriptional MerR regulator
VWTIDELVERVGVALAETCPGVPSGRVRDVPDRRAIRWYATTGLVDRPVAMRGRVALYGPRHLLQLVAIKRRQADGRSLAEIQVELAGASDATLTATAGVPDALLAADDPPPTIPPTRSRFWAAAQTPTAPTPTAQTPTAQTPTAQTPAAQTPTAQTPAAQTPTAQTPAAQTSAAPLPAAAVSAAPITGVPLPAGPDLVWTLGAIALGGGAVLLLPGKPEPADVDAIGDAARPLLAALAARGLLDHVAAPADRWRRDDMYPPADLHLEYEVGVQHRAEPAEPDHAGVHGVRTERSPS